METTRKQRKIAARRAARDQARELNDGALRIRRLENYRTTLLAEMSEMLEMPEPFGSLAHYMAVERLHDVHRALYIEWWRLAH